MFLVFSVQYTAITAHKARQYFSSISKEEKKMKKILALGLALMLTLSLLTACGGGGSSNALSGSNTATTPPASSNTDSGNNTNNNSPKATKDVIPASALISVEEATAIVEQKMEASNSEPLKKHFVDETRYRSADFSFAIALWQEALHDENDSFENDLLKKGWTSYLQKMEEAYVKNNADQNIIQISGISGTSYIQEGAGYGQWLLHIFYGDYYIHLVIGNTTGPSRIDTEDELTWKHEKLIEAGKLALERLKAIVG